MRKRRKVKRDNHPFPLKDILARYEVSQNEVAKRTGISQRRINALANGHHQPTWQTIRAILTSIGADLGDLVPGRKASEATGQGKSVA